MSYNNGKNLGSLHYENEKNELWIANEFSLFPSNTAWKIANVKRSAIYTAGDKLYECQQQITKNQHNWKTITS